MIEKMPYFPFYPKDWFDVKVQRMSFEAQGIYLKILCFMWKDSKNQSSISSDPKFLSKALGINIKKYNKIIEEIQHKNDPIFSEKNEKYYSLRLAKERRKYLKWKRQCSEAGKRGAKERWRRYNEANEVANVSLIAKYSNSISTSTSLKNKEKHKYMSDIFDYWKEKLNHPTSKLTSDRKTKIKARIDDRYTVDQIKQAIDGCASSSYHMGDNDTNTVYDDLTLICRNGSKLEFFMSLAKNKEPYYCKLSDGTKIKTQNELERLDREGKIEYNERKKQWEKTTK